MRMGTQQQWSENKNNNFTIIFDTGMGRNRGGGVKTSVLFQKHTCSFYSF